MSERVARWWLEILFGWTLVLLALFVAGMVTGEAEAYRQGVKAQAARCFGGKR